MKRPARVISSVVIIVLLALLGGAIVLSAPVGDPDLTSRPDPATSYQDALGRIATVRAAETKLPLQTITHSFALLHGSTVATAVVIFHGYTHSPYQWRAAAKGFYDAGYNVWVPLAPYHGYADRMTDALSLLTPGKLRAYADGAVDIGAGLGRHVEVVGLSTGGDLVAWTAAERPDVDRAIAIAPLQAPKGVPGWVLMPAARFFRYVPDVFNWWSQTAKQNNPGPAYPRFSFRGIFAFIQMSEWALRDAERKPFPVAGSYELVINDNDKSVDNAWALHVTRLLARPGRLKIFDIPASYGFGHDLVEPAGENKAVIGRVYPVLGLARGVTLPDPVPYSRDATP